MLFFNAKKNDTSRNWSLIKQDSFNLNLHSTSHASFFIGKEASSSDERDRNQVWWVIEGSPVHLTILVIYISVWFLLLMEVQPFQAMHSPFSGTETKWDYWSFGPIWSMLFVVMVLDSW